MGPELVAELWRRRIELALPPLVAIGPRAALTGVPTVAITHIAQRAEITSDTLACFDVPAAAPIVPGQPGAHTAQAAWESLQLAADLALGHAIAAVVTAPISKAQMYGVGFSHPGQTEFFAAACAAPRYAMMLAGPELRTVPLTIHVPLAAVEGLVTKVAIIEMAELVINALRQDFGIARPRLAICGLNPHAGEQGALGDTEIRIIAPAIAALQAGGHAVLGPLPADSAFAPHIRPSFDAALCMYHDQALVPVKTLDFDRTVNVTLGLPIIRTSPDHGTAFDIAGRGMARPESMIAAVQLAQSMARHRRRPL